MKVLHINDYSPHAASGGGAEVLMAQTMQLLRDSGVDVDVFTSKNLPGNRLTPIRYIDNHAARTALRNRLREFHPDVVHLHNFYHVLSPGILAELAEFRHQSHSHSGVRMRIVMTAHDYHLACPSSGATWFAGRAPERSDDGAASTSKDSIQVADAARLGSLPYLLARRWDRRGWRYSNLKLLQHLWNYRIHRRRRIIDCVICPSRFMERVMKGVGLTTVFLPHPSPTITNLAATTRPAHLRLVFAGRIEPEKGLAEFLDLLSQDFDGTMTIVGDGVQMDRCLDVCRKRRLTDRVEFTGRLSHAQTMAVIARCHVLVLPSLWWENSPLSLLEALALGTNILVSDLGGMREVVDTAGIGHAFTPGDGASLRATLDRINLSHRDGTLNGFAISSELSQRTDDAYLKGLMNVYRGAAAGVDR